MSPDNGNAPQAPELSVVKRNDDWVVQSAEDTVFGPSVKTRAEAEALLQDWKRYYTQDNEV